MKNETKKKGSGKSAPKKVEKKAAKKAVKKSAKKTGKPLAKNRGNKTVSEITTRQTYSLAALLVLPCAAMIKLAFFDKLAWAVLCVLGAMLILQLISFIQLRRDKKKAEADEWRISEPSLHMLEFLGGWPGSFVAQRRYRHKTAKRSYQIAYWLIVVCHLALALDLLFDGVAYTIVHGVLSSLQDSIKPS